MELLNRPLQSEMLRRLSDRYPHSSDIYELLPEVDEHRTDYNLFYLREHGLVDFRSDELSSGQFVIGDVTITAAGIDFISNDGGLSGILGVVTIKLHEDTIRDLLIRQVTAAPGDESVKGKLIGKIRELPADALGKVSEKAMEKGIASIPDVVGWLIGIFGL